MRIFRENNTVWIGLLLGITIPVLGYFCIEQLFIALTNAGIMDEVTLGSQTKRMRTLALVGLCFNIIPVQYFKSRFYDKINKGIIIATLIYACLWFLYFYASLYK